MDVWLIEFGLPPIQSSLPLGISWGKERNRAVVDVLSFSFFCFGFFLETVIIKWLCCEYCSVVERIQILLSSWSNLHNFFLYICLYSY